MLNSYEIYERDRYRCPAGRSDDVYRSSEYIFVMMIMMGELCANMRPGSNDRRKQIGMFLAARARGLSSHSRDHQSSINVYWPQDDEFTVTRVSTALTRPKLMLSSSDILRTLCEVPIAALLA